MPPSADVFTINLYVALASPLVGSALAAMSMRLAAGQAWGLTPSACGSCGKRLGVLELIPVISWLAQRGRCRSCKAAIPVDYPLIELAAAGVAVWAWLATPPHIFIASCVMGWLLVALSAVDIRTRRLPDILNLTLVIAGLVTAALIDVSRIWEHVLGAALGYGAFVAIEVSYRILRGRDGLGRGDAKLLAGIGAWVGPIGLPSCVFVAALGAIVCVLTINVLKGRGVRGDTDIAFGPFLAAGGWITWVTGPLIF